jgi:hypothetical protein
MSDADTKVLELALQAISKALDALCAECLDESGKPKAPSRQSIMKARAMLPPYCDQALSKK